MDAKNTETVFKITSDIHDDVTEIYEGIVENDPKVGTKIDNVINKLKQLKGNIKVSNDI